jgi:hypothetical protein
MTHALGWEPTLGTKAIKASFVPETPAATLSKTAPELGDQTLP